VRRIFFTTTTSSLDITCHNDLKIGMVDPSGDRFCATEVAWFFATWFLSPFFDPRFPFSVLPCETKIPQYLGFGAMNRKSSRWPKHIAMRAVPFSSRGWLFEKALLIFEKHLETCRVVVPNLERLFLGRFFYFIACSLRTYRWTGGRLHLTNGQSYLYRDKRAHLETFELRFEIHSCALFGHGGGGVISVRPYVRRET